MNSKEQKEQVREMNRTQLSPVIRLDNLSVSVLHKELKDHTCDKRSRQLCRAESSLRNITACGRQ